MYIRNFICATMILYCGVASAEPTSEEHSIRHHPELAVPAFCMASYLLALEGAVSSGQSNQLRTELYNRGRGLTISTYGYAEQVGHSPAELDEVVSAIAVAINELEFETWLQYMREVDCKTLTNQWSGYDQS